ncbi:MAG TPA: acyltransferase [Actinoplanes sp.]
MTDRHPPPLDLAIEQSTEPVRRLPAFDRAVEQSAEPVRRLPALDRAVEQSAEPARRLPALELAGRQTAEPARGAAGGRHLAALDVVRVLTVGLVIAVHTVSLQPGGIGWSNGAVLVVTHVSREVFFLLTAFVLTYAYRGQPWPAFWRRRFLLVGVPYLVWSAIYVLAAGQPRRLPVALLTGTASYHLYFLLVSMQLYLVFPLLRRLLRATAGRHRAVFVAAVAYQLTAYAILPHLIARPDALLISYLGFVVVGGIAAVHAVPLLAWTGRHRGAVLLSAIAVTVCGLGWFVLQTVVLHRDPTTASAVFQPLIVIESVAVAWAFLALGLSRRGEAFRTGAFRVGAFRAGAFRAGAFRTRVFRAGADVSFGVYLAHPLLLQGLLVAGLGGLVAGLPQPLVTLLALAVVVPAVYLICAVVVAALRRTRLSLALTGHPLPGGSR